MKKVTIIGSGNIGLSLAKGLVKSEFAEASNITLTRRNLNALAEESSQGFSVSSDNKSAVKGADIVVFAILPQQLKKVLVEVAPVIDKENQIFVSIVSGVSCADLKAELGADATVVRAMPNTAIAIAQSMTCIASDNA